MAKAYANLATIMSNPNMSLSYTPFNPEVVVIKRASFPGGKVPAHLAPYLIPAGTGKGLLGTVIYKGKLVPKTAAHIAETRAKALPRARELLR